MTTPRPHSDSVNAATTAPDRIWHELSVEVDTEAVEPVSELFGRHGFNEGVAIDEPYVQDGDGDNLEMDPDRPYVVRTYVADSDFRPQAIDDIRHALWHLGRIGRVGELKDTLLKEEDWANAWKVHFEVHRIGQRVVIRPPWQEYEAKDDEVVVELDPGMAFGTGLHPSTKLSMLGVEQVVRDGDRVFDVGTGSGILAIAALKLGAKEADAVDVETIAVRATRENAERNGVSDRLNVALGTAGPGEPFEGQYDVVLANIIARILIELSEHLVRATRHGGSLVLAGIIESREADVVDAFAARGATVKTRRQTDDWVSLVLVRE
ncbi:MAG: Ribosomal protein L11 methyltransferase [uncultured Thermomicrobiales bacterium]|uniref:Ribosomal protein L11 methyltransferase n=1 Tax=uncultured Thermomicrobiales bacterium TaxID=1645740 RepID=A0A6J4UDX6_9BACT|nr:MAG: Ribosomal protein L11 methyltransferase [uncultured Thermomicrobiales bacterium]